jgi:NitT/TauT family transport system permease protein
MLSTVRSIAKWVAAPRVLTSPSAAPARGTLSRGTYMFLASLSFVGVGCAWCALTYGGFVESYFLSSPSQVARATQVLFEMQGFAHDVVMSIFRIAAGFLISAVLAVPLGVLMSRSEVIQALVAPITSFVRYLPVPALLPFFILWFGIGELEKIAVVVIGVFFQLVLIIADIARNTPTELVDIAYTLGVTRRRALWRVILPWSSPMIFDSLRITLGWAWGWVMLAELVGASEGIGFMILKSQRYLLNANMIVGLLVIGLLGLLSDLTLAFVGRVLFPWRES